VLEDGGSAPCAAARARLRLKASSRHFLRKAQKVVEGEGLVSPCSTAPSA